jgi:hypothetical protein
MIRDRYRPWSVDRWGRLLAGCSVLILTALGLLHHPSWLIGTILCAANLVVTSLTDWCPLRGLLLQLNVKEREDLFFPGGSIRPEAGSRRDLCKIDERVKAVHGK